MIILYALIFYWAFAATISVYRRWLAGDLNVWNKIAFLPVLLIFALIDVTLNYTLFLLMGLPPARCYTISARLEAYHTGGPSWKRTVAVFICETLLNPIDPSGRHC